MATAVTALLSSPDGANISFARATCAGPYLNLWLSPKFLGRAVLAVHDGTFLAPLSSVGKERVMIEYSQPNTHKAFHVGHMRNVALGGALINLFEQFGHPVTAANYFGDEGAHVAKCLWHLRESIAKEHIDLDVCFFS